MISQDAMLAYDAIFICGKKARQDLVKSCEARGIESHYSFLPTKDVETYLEICNEVFARWHTTDKFKVGEKVYVVPGEPSILKTCIRATITEIDEKWGYHLRAFKQDLPAIFLFNIWDKDLMPRTGKANKIVE